MQKHHYFKQASVDGHLSFSEFLAIISIYHVFSYESVEHLRMDVLNHTHLKPGHYLIDLQRACVKSLVAIKLIGLPTRG